MPPAAPYRLGIDVGGTFTDLVLVDEATGGLATEKILTTPSDPSLGALAGVDRFAEHGYELSLASSVIHATTLVGNLLIERKGARTGLIATRGFRDVLHFVGRELRYDMYDPNLVFPEPLVPRALRLEVDERVDGTGAVLRPLDEGSARAAIAALLEAGVETIAVVLLNSFLRPDHEARIGALIREQSASTAVSLSHEVLPTIREYERTSATVMNAYVQPAIGSYLTRLETGLTDRGFGGRLYLMASTGGIVSTDTAKRLPLQLVESGPTAGALAATFVTEAAGLSSVLSFDMGGTTAKAAIVKDGRPLMSTSHEVMRMARFKRGSGLPVGITVADLLEIGAGGGSIAEIDKLGLLRVGPRSAGADPGPACYARGGTEPTVTDADLVLGFLDPDYFLGGAMRLDTGAARDAIERAVAEPLGLSVLDAAAAIHRVVVKNMAEAARVHSVEMNVDIRRHAVVAFGGAGPVHAYDVARELHARCVLCPASAGVLSALGLLVAPLTYEALHTWPQDVASISEGHAREIFGGLRRQVDAVLAEVTADPISYEASVELRYIGQGFEVATPAGDGTTPVSGPMLKEAFDDAYGERYGRRLDDIPARAMTWRVVGTAATPRPYIAPSTTAVRAARKGERRVVFPDVGPESACPVYERSALPPGAEVAGPAILQERHSSVVVPPGTRATIDDRLGVTIELG